MKIEVDVTYTCDLDERYRARIKGGEVKIYDKTQERDGHEVEVRMATALWALVHEFVRRVQEIELVLQKLEEDSGARRSLREVMSSVRSRVEGNCPECGKPYSQCDPEGVGHYRG